MQSIIWRRLRRGSFALLVYGFVSAGLMLSQNNTKPPAHAQPPARQTPPAHTQAPARQAPPAARPAHEGAAPGRMQPNAPAYPGRQPNAPAYPGRQPGQQNQPGAPGRETPSGPQAGGNARPEAPATDGRRFGRNGDANQPGRNAGRAEGVGNQPARPGMQGSRPGGMPQGYQARFAHPEGRPMVMPGRDGGSVSRYSNNTSVMRDRQGRTTHFSDPGHGMEARIDPRTGRPTHILIGRPGNATMISRGPLNERRIEVVRTVPGGVEHVVHYGSWTSVQRPVAGRVGYVQRTVFVGERQHSVVYRSFGYRGIPLLRVVTPVVFAPVYYRWLMTPWGQPVIFAPAAWGWADQPWYAAYGPGFRPYPVYNSGDQWLTDYVISANLQEAYANQQALAADGGPDTEAPPPPQITEADKALMNQDIKDELAREQAAAAAADAANGMSNPPLPYGGAAPPPSMDLPEALKDHLFTVYTAPLEVQTASGQSCNLTEGDMLFRTGNMLNMDRTVDVLVKFSHATASHPELCAPQTAAKVQLTDLQEMYNHKKELLAQGVAQQAKLMGKPQGLPKGPDPKPVEVAQAKPDPDTAAAVAELKQMMQDADNAEKEVTAVASTPAGGPAN